MSLKRLEPLQCLFCFVFVVYSFIFLLLSFLNSFCECFFLFVWEWFFFADPLVSLISLSLVCNNKLMVCFLFCFLVLFMFSLFFFLTCGCIISTWWFEVLLQKLLTPCPLISRIWVKIVKKKRWREQCSVRLLFAMQCIRSNTKVHSEIRIEFVANSTLVIIEKIFFCFRISIEFDSYFMMNSRLSGHCSDWANSYSGVQSNEFRSNRAIRKKCRIAPVKFTVNSGLEEFERSPK